jgi:hypothetical protein
MGGGDFPAFFPEISIEVAHFAQLHYGGYSAIHGGTVGNCMLLQTVRRLKSLYLGSEC